MIERSIIKCSLLPLKLVVMCYIKTVTCYHFTGLGSAVSEQQYIYLISVGNFCWGTEREIILKPI